MRPPLAPGATLGVIGGGQLGRMFVHAAQRLGYRVAVWTIEADSPAAAAADESVVSDAYDAASLRRFSERVQAVTVEFENVSAAALRVLAKSQPANPGWRAIRVAQNRIREKSFLAGLGVPVAPWGPIRTRDELHLAQSALSGPSILKTAALGYDGRGQARVANRDELASAWHKFSEVPCVLEGLVEFAAEVSCLVARGADGECVAYPVFLNEHRRHILDTTICPAPIGPLVTARVQSIAREIAAALGVVGLLTVEFFLKSDGSPIVNELAPRPHNSAHLTIEACATSQFEQQVRALVGLPLGSTRLRSPAAMANLLGDCWQGGEPDWAAPVARDRELHVHMYGKTDAKPGRKMGHLTVLDSDVEVALSRVLAARSALTARYDAAFSASDVTRP